MSFHVPASLLIFRTYDVCQVLKINLNNVHTKRVKCNPTEIHGRNVSTFLQLRNANTLALKKISNSEVLASVLWNSRGVILIDYLEKKISLSVGFV